MENGAFANRNFIAGLILTIFTGFYLAIDSIILGKEDFFLLLNTDLGSTADLFFRYWTNLGDGIVWVAVAVYFYFYQKNKFPLLIISIIISTLITQLTKNFLYPDITRPTASIADISKIHTVPGVELLTSYSFPSGHTATAFTIFLMACLLIKKISVVPLGFLYAVLVGYSRIYLAQHFPLDVGGGMLTAVITILVAVFIQNIWEARIEKQELKK